MCYPIIFAVNPVNTGRRTTVNNAPRIGSQLWLCSVLVFFLVPAAPHLFTCSMTVMRDEILKRELFACLAALGTTTWTRIGWPGPGQASFTCRVAAPAPAWSLQGETSQSLGTALRAARGPQSRLARSLASRLGDTSVRSVPFPSTPHQPPPSPRHATRSPRPAASTFAHYVEYLGSAGQLGLLPAGPLRRPLQQVHPPQQVTGAAQHSPAHTLPHFTTRRASRGRRDPSHTHCMSRRNDRTSRYVTLRHDRAGRRTREARRVTTGGNFSSLTARASWERFSAPLLASN